MQPNKEQKEQTFLQRLDAALRAAKAGQSNVKTIKRSATEGFS